MVEHEGVRKPAPERGSPPVYVVLRLCGYARAVTEALFREQVIEEGRNRLVGTVIAWRMGLPVITSATPAYRRAMNEVGTPELTCQNESQWIAALDRMMSDEAARLDAAKRGRAYAEGKHGSAALLARWDAMFSSLGFFFGTSPGAHERQSAAGE